MYKRQAEGVHGILVAVLVQQADLFALDIRDGALEVADRTADIPRAVSYTHLDVYKRQGHSSAPQA